MTQKMLAAEQGIGQGPLQRMRVLSGSKPRKIEEPIPQKGRNMREWALSSASVFLALVCHTSSILDAFSNPLQDDLQLL